MKFLRLKLTNYIGIYNGLGLRDIEIDFTRCMHKIIIIKGDNGSGKSTIMKALSVFPDNNALFIPGLEASKEIAIADNGVVYNIFFHHPVNSNGDRLQSKVHIFKNNVDLNPNGNIRSYRSIIFDELSLDDNFEALSQLSLTDRGLADKTPSERKRFVNSILSSMDVYNDIYKTISKKASTYKSLISNISSKLNNIGDTSIHKDNLIQVEKQINELQAAKDMAVLTAGEKTAELNMIDSDGQIQNRYKDLVGRTNQLSRTLEKLIAQLLKSYTDITGIVSNSLDLEMIDKLKASYADKLSKLRFDIRIKRNELENLLTARETQTQDVQRRALNLKKYTGDTNYEELLHTIEDVESRVKELEDNIPTEYIASSITEEELNIIRDTITHLKDEVSDILAMFPGVDDFNEAPTRGTEYLNIDAFKKSYDARRQEYLEFKTTIPKIEADLSIINILDKRPSDCTNDECPLVAEAIKKAKEFYANQDNWTFDRRNPQSMYEKHDELLAKMDEAKAAYDKALLYKEFANRRISMIHEVNRIYPLLNKINGIKNFALPASAELFVDAVFNNDFIIDALIILLNDFIANKSLVSSYKLYNKKLAELYGEKASYDSKMDIIDDLTKDIVDLNFKLSQIAGDIESANAEIQSMDNNASELEKTIDRINALDRKLKEYYDEASEYSLLSDELIKMQEDMDKINSIKDEISEATKKAAGFNQSMIPLRNQRDSINHALKLAEDYKNELAQLNTEYYTLDLIRKYSSPTTGIQLVFMELYMGKIINLANNLLSLLFGGSFVILPFIINENEFRIPCQGNGYQNDDISSTSSAQLAMISMILSFSLLYSSSTRYNIIKLDEIDGPLDETNRAMFLDVLDKIMNIMGTEQCIMISHNSELDINNSDIILLRNSSGSAYTSGNIIWAYGG